MRARGLGWWIGIALLVGCAEGKDPPPSVAAAASVPAPTAPPPPASPPVPAVAPELAGYYASLDASFGNQTRNCPPVKLANAIPCPSGLFASTVPPRNVLVILDASYSMGAPRGDGTKFDVARDAILAWVSRVEPGTRVGLRVYGHRGDNTAQDMRNACRGTDLVLPFGAVDRPGWQGALGAIQPRGHGPVATALQLAGADFIRAGAGAEGNSVLLVSDGLDTCGRDPASVARWLNASAHKVVVNVIGLETDAAVDAQLFAVAQAGGGAYRIARNGEALMALLDQDMSALRTEFQCRSGPTTMAFQRESDSRAQRFICLLRAAPRERESVVGTANAALKAGRVTPEQHAYAIRQAEAKYRATMQDSMSGMTPETL